MTTHKPFTRRFCAPDRLALLTIILILSSAAFWTSKAQVYEPSRYEIGAITTRDLWVDPVSGNDANSGLSPTNAIRTLVEAWSRIPAWTPLTNGWRIRLRPGHYSQSGIPIYMEGRLGSYSTPVIIEAEQGPNTAFLHRYLNIYGCAYLYLIGINIVTDPGYGGGGDALHFELCDHVLVRSCVIDGFDGSINQPHETLKANQSKYVYIEDSYIKGAEQNVIDFVAVQYGHVVGNRLEDAADWIMYVKGGSAGLLIEGNSFRNGITGGFSAGEGTGFEFMVAPWLHYEAADIKFVNNIIRNTRIAGMGVSGGYNILLAHNTLYRVGTNDHVIEVNRGGRACDGDTAACISNRNAGGWGDAVSAGDFIPSKNVYIYNNIVLNPAGAFAGWQHFNIAGPTAPPPGLGIPSPARSDDNLHIRGNIIWSGPTNTPLGIESCDICGCQTSNPECNEMRIRAENAINTIYPLLRDPENGDFRPVPTGGVFAAVAYEIPPFPGGDRPSPPLAPEGVLSNAVPRERGGSPRYSALPAGAYTGGSSMRFFGHTPGQVWWTAETGHTYRVERSDDLLSWALLAQTNTITQTNTTLDSSAHPDSRFYRLRLIN